MSMIRVEHLTFGYEGSHDLIFDDVSFELDTDWKLGFIGRNGRGKTTFLRLLMGQLHGAGCIRTQVSFDYFPFAVPDAHETVGEMARHVAADVDAWRFQRELNLLEVEEGVLYRPYQTLSYGEQTKVLLALLFARDNRFLLIDEPTNHLDVQGRCAVGRYLNGKKGFILVSHDRAFLDDCIDHVLTIGRARIAVQRGNYSTWEENKRRQDAYEFAENAKLKSEVGRLRQAAQRTADWSDRTERGKIGQGSADRGYIGHKAAKMMKRAKNVQARQERAAQQREQLLHDVDASDSLCLQPLHYVKDRLITLQNVTVQYGAQPVCERVCLAIDRGERVALTGPNGCGKSSLLRLVLGGTVPYTGQMQRGTQLIVSSIPQGVEHLRGGLMDFARAHQVDASRMMTILRKMDFTRAQLGKDLVHLSMGQRKKVLLAASLCQRAHLYVWDEPLNYIDVLSRVQLEDVIRTCAPTMLFVEHDRTFVAAVATRTVAL